MTISITEVKRPTDRTYRNANGIHAKVDKLLDEPIGQNRLLQTFNYYERAEAGRYLKGLIEDGKVIVKKVQGAHGGTPATILKWA